MAATDNISRNISQSEARKTVAGKAAAATEYFMGAFGFWSNTDTVLLAHATASLRFAGMIMDYHNNTGAATTGDDKPVRLQTSLIVAAPVTGLVAGQIGDPVFAVDDGELTMTSTDNTQVGVIQDFVSAGNGRVLLQGKELQ